MFKIRALNQVVIKKILDMKIALEVVRVFRKFKNPTTLVVVVSERRL